MAEFLWPLAPTLTVAPSGDVVTLAEAKAHCRVNSSDDDTLIQAMIDAAVARLDGWTGILGRCLLAQTWTAYFSDFSAVRLRLPLRPVTGVSSVKYYDASNVLQTASSSLYALKTDFKGAYVTLAPDQDWPTSLEDREDAVQIAYAVGYENAAAVPAPIKAAIKLRVADMYEHRESFVVGAVIAEAPMSHVEMALLAPFGAAHSF